MYALVKLLLLGCWGGSICPVDNAGMICPVFVGCGAAACCSPELRVMTLSDKKEEETTTAVTLGVVRHGPSHSQHVGSPPLDLVGANTHLWVITLIALRHTGW